MVSKIKQFLLGYVRFWCVFEPLKIMVKLGYCSFNLQLSSCVKKHRSPCSGPSTLYQGLSTCHDWPFQKGDCSKDSRKLRTGSKQKASVLTAEEKIECRFQGNQNLHVGATSRKTPGLEISTQKNCRASTSRITRPVWRVWLGYSRKNPHPPPPPDGWQGFFDPPLPSHPDFLDHCDPPPTRISKAKDLPSRLDFHYVLQALNLFYRR